MIRSVNRLLSRLFGRDQEGGPRARLHWQNLNEGRDGGVEGPGWRAGRAWLHVDRVCLNPEWHVGNGHSLGWKVELGGYDDDLTFGLYLPGASFWLSVGSPRIARLCYRAGGGSGHREVSLSLSTEYLRWHGWTDPDEWNRGTPWWRYASVNIPDLVLGKAAYDSRVFHTAQVELPLPEATYPATVEMSVATWKRPRWPWPHRVVRAEITPDRKGGVPVPGKGENAWDQGEDAIHSMTTPAESVEDAIAAFVASALRTRGRYGGRNWRPEAVA